MASFNIFDNDAFSMQQLLGGIEDMPYNPTMVQSLNLFERTPIRTRIASIERRDSSLNLIKSSPLGAPLEQLDTGDRELYHFNTVRLAKGDTINASELESIRAFGTESELQAVANEVSRRLLLLNQDIQLTSEYMMLGALQGKMLDGDGTTLVDWFTKFGVAQDAEINFAFAGLGLGELHEKCNQLIRKMIRKSNGTIGLGSRIIAFCGDSFFDNLTKNADVIERSRNAVEAKVVIGGGAYGTVEYGNITWVNYRGTDDNSQVAVGNSKAIFFPMGARGMFQEILSPDESLEGVNTLGRDLYPMIVPDRDRNHWVKIELYKYPLYMCTNPQVLQRGKQA